MTSEIADEPWIETFNGGKFRPLAPRVEDVRLADIAHALAMKCRFAGHVKCFYSVAQHSVLGAEEALRQGDEVLAKAFLLHDAAEAYLFDCPKPIKHEVAFKVDVGSIGFSMKEIEDEIVRTVFIALSNSSIATFARQAPAEFVRFNSEMVCKVKQLDLRMLATEARDLMPSGGVGWECLRGVEPFEWRTQITDGELTFCWTPLVAEKEFLALARRLGLRESA